MSEICWLGICMLLALGCIIGMFIEPRDTNDSVPWR